MQPGQQMSCPCMQGMHDMMGSPMMWIVGILGVVVLLATIGALISLSVFLVRRSRSEAHAP